MNFSALEDIGLTSGEIKVYLALLNLGSTKTGALALKAGVSSSKVYKILDRLEQKGLAGHVIKEGTKFYRALESDRLLEFVDEKEKELSRKRAAIESLLPSLEKRRGSSSVPEATVYSGLKAVSGFFNNILEELGPGDCYSVVGVRYFGDVERMKRFFFKYHQKRARKKIKLRMLANEDSREDVVKPTFSNAEIRFLPNSFPLQMTVVFYKHKTFIIVWGDDTFGFLIESKQVAKSFETYFENFWKISKK